MDACERERVMIDGGRMSEGKVAADIHAARVAAAHIAVVHAAMRRMVHHMVVRVVHGGARARCWGSKCAAAVDWKSLNWMMQL